MHAKHPPPLDVRQRAGEDPSRATKVKLLIQEDVSSRFLETLSIIGDPASVSLLPRDNGCSSWRRAVRGGLVGRERRGGAVAGLAAGVGRRRGVPAPDSAPGVRDEGEDGRAAGAVRRGSDYEPAA